MKRLRIEVYLDPILDPDSGKEEYIAKISEFNENDDEWYYTGVHRKDIYIYDAFIAAHLATLE